MRGRSQKLLSVGLLLIFVLPVLPVRAATDNTPSDWLKPDPVISNNFDLPPGELIPYSVNGNRECTSQRIVTRPRKVLPYWPYIQHEQSHNSCVVNTSYGAVSLSGYLQVPGENTFGTVHYPWGKKMTLFPVPNATGAIYLEPNLPNGVIMTLIPNFLANISATTLANGEIYFTVKDGASIKQLKGPDNKPLGVALDSVSFSFGGKWMVADIPYLGLTRIDTTSLTLKTFDPTYFNYDIGSSPAAQTAVTASGRYAVVASSSFTFFKLYDLEDCTDNKNCRSINLHNYFKAAMPGFIGAHRLRFGSDYSLRMYILHQPPGKSKTVTGLTLRATGHEAAGFEYLGLGDSFASGEGAFQYKAITDTDDNECHLSLRSYPYLIGSQLEMNSYESVACSGARMKDISSYNPEYIGQVNNHDEAKLRDTNEILMGFEPGILAQNNFLSTYEPETISLSISGNDIGFSDKLKKCLMPGTCYKYYEDRLEAALEVNDQFSRLSQLYSDIKILMPEKKVFVIGYPEIVYEGGVCYGNVYLDGEEVKFANQLVRHLNGMIKAAASKAGFYYVDVEKAFVGHRLCETDYPNVAVNGITVGDDTNIPFTHIDLGGPIGNESYHPNDMGHRKLKDTILSKTSNFTAPMPTPNENAQPPEISSSMELLKDAPRAFRTTKNVKQISKHVQSRVLRNEEIKGTITLTESGFKPSSEIEIWMHSEPVKLGNFMTDAQGNLEFQFTIPPDTPYGFHTIHIYGKGLTNQEIDLQQVVQVVDEPMPDQEDEEAPIFNESPKPPENNPETVAGHEQTNSEQKASETFVARNEAPEVATQSTGSSPYFAPATAEQRVEGVQTLASSTPVNSVINSGDKASEPTSQDNWPVWMLPAGILLVIGALYPIRKNR